MHVFTETAFQGGQQDASSAFNGQDSCMLSSSIDIRRVSTLWRRKPPVDTAAAGSRRSQKLVATATGHCGVYTYAAVLDCGATKQTS